MISPSFSLRPHLHIPRQPILCPHPTTTLPSSPAPIRTHHPNPQLPLRCTRRFTCHSTLKPQIPQETDISISSDGSSGRVLLLGAASLGLALLFMGFDGKEAMAFGPEGPLVEEFWDNMRRYGLYVLTVSTGVAYAIFEPILELLKNPVSAILIITILVGSGYLLSQVLSLMVGISDFAYDYAN